MDGEVERMNQLIYSEEIFTIGSSEIFQLRAYKDGLLWDLTGASIVLKIAKPDGTIINLSPLSVYNGGATVGWTVIGPASKDWYAAWDITDAQGVRQISPPIRLTIESSPI
jgi:hypothetical protein